MEHSPLAEDVAPKAGDAPRSRRKRRVGRYVAGLLGVGVMGIVALRAGTIHRWIMGGAGEPPRFHGSDVRAPAATRVRVELFNATQHRGLGRRAMLYLRDQGFDVVTLGPVSTLRDTTLVVGRGTHVDWAQLVSRALGTARVASGTDSSRDVDVSVYLGSTWRPPAQPFYP